MVQFNYGLLYSWTSPYLPQLLSLASPIPITFEDTSYLIMVLPAARMLSAPAFATMVDIIGRRDLVILTCIPYTVAWILIYFATSTTYLYISRFATGIGDAALFTALPMYVGEIAEPNIRGTWGTLIIVNVIMGQVVINIVGSLWDMQTTSLVFGVMPALCAGACLLIPRSPYYLTAKSRKSEAVTSLRRLRCKLDVQEEFLRLQQVVKDQTEAEGSFCDLFRIASNRKATLISLAMRAIQQFSGLPVFAFYTQYIFQESGGALSESLSSIIYTGFFFICTALSACLMGRTSRRSAMILSTTASTTFLVVEAVYFFAKQNEDYTLDVETFGWVPLGGMMGYIISCSLGMVLVPSVILSELFPVSVKGKAMCLNNVAAAVNDLFVSKIFQLLASNYGMFAPFAFFSVFCMLGIVFSWFLMPETKGRSLGEIQHYLKHGKYATEVEGVKHVCSASMHTLNT